MGPYNNYYYNYYKNYRNPYMQKAQPSFDVHKEELEPIAKSEDSDDNRFEDEQKNSSKYNSFGPISFTNPLFADMDEPVIEILGIKLYLDDIIILGLLFFLYKEDVKDEMLFLSLILLLIG